MDARPQFFEGQYIGADDLQTIVAYARARHAQHLLAGHGWGVAAGLELIEQPNPDGSVSVWLQPGYAWDGYGRSILVDTPTPIDATQLQGSPTGAWFVSLAYTETLQDAVSASFGVCDGTNTFLRIAEGFRIVISATPQLGQMQSGVVESGTLRPDPRLVRRISDPTGPFLCDANVPEQGDNPLGGKAVWLIPLGMVGWNSGTQQVVRLNPLQRQNARLFRRNVASVAEEILAPGGLLRLRPHGILDATKKDTDVNTVCTAGQPLTTDLVTVGDRVTFDDLVWVEGNLRVLGNARIYGGQVDFRMGDGTEPAGSLFARRSAASAATTDLEIAIGNAPAGPGPVNRLVVAPAKGGKLATPPALAVLADGRVGIGVAVPATGLALDVNGDFGHDAGPTAVHLMGSRISDAGDGILLLTGGSNVVELGADGGNAQVGINTKLPQPGAALDVHGSGIVRGNLTVNGVFNNPSDARLKRDIQPLDGALGRLLSLRGVEFEWSRADLASLRPGRQVGMIADDVERVFPAWVNVDPSTGMKMLSPQGFEGVVVEAIRELSEKVDGLAANGHALRECARRVEALTRETQVLQGLAARVEALAEHTAKLERSLGAEKRAVGELATRVEVLERENLALRQRSAGSGQPPPEEVPPPSPARKTRAKR
ncbi:MAG: tail fiber domain-containing protein [Rhodopila sp.]